MTSSQDAPSKQGQIKIASWNVNSIKARLPNVIEWLEETCPDIVLLQELKCQDHMFPALEIEELGYNIATVGQKTYNGVAILSKFPIEIESRTLPGDDNDEQARFLEAIIGTLRVCCLYLPNGNPVESEKYTYKLAWMERLIAHTKTLLSQEETFILAGDFNVIPHANDCWDPEVWENDALFKLETREKFRELCNLGLVDAFCAKNPTPYQYTYWDYRKGSWNRNEGIRIDHFLLSPLAADRLEESFIDRTPRGKTKASDHTPILCTLTHL